MIFKINDEISFIVCHFFRGSEVHHVELAFVDPVVVRLDISMDDASVVYLSQCFQHFLCYICHDSVENLSFRHSVIDMFLQGLLKVLYDEISSPILLSMVIVFGNTSKRCIITEYSIIIAFFEDIRVSIIIMIELDSAKLRRLHFLI